MMQKLASAAGSPAGSFEDIKKRIEAQSEAERQESCRQTLELLGEEEIAVKPLSGAKRFAVAAAAMAAVLGLGAALIGLAFGLGGAMDGAVNESMTAEDAAVETPVIDEVPCESEESPEEPVGQPDGAAPDGSAPESTTDGAPTQGDDETDGAVDGIGVMEENTAEPGEDTLGYTVHNFVSCRVDALGMELLLPSKAYITGRDVWAGFELLELYGMSEAQLEANYKSRNIYYNAVWYDSDADVTEVVITMTEDETSRRIFSLAAASEEELAKISELYKSYGDTHQPVAGARYFDVSTQQVGEVLFFRAMGTVDNRSSRSNHLQYMTVVNGMRIEITLIEHFGIDSELTGEEPEEVSGLHEKMMDSIIGSVRFDRVRSGWLQQNRGPVFYALLFAAGIAAIVIVLLLPENRKKRGQAEQEAQEEQKYTPPASPQEESQPGDSFASGVSSPTQNSENPEEAAPTGEDAPPQESIETDAPGDEAEN